MRRPNPLFARSPDAAFSLVSHALTLPAPPPREVSTSEGDRLIAR